MEQCKKAGQQFFLWLCAHWEKPVICILILCMLMGCCWYAHRWMEPGEADIRNRIVTTAQSYLGSREEDGTHRKIIDLYNSSEPNPRNYAVTYEDNWCAAFGSAVAIQCAMEDWIPIECSCEQQILLFNRYGDWEEQDWYLPQPGDYIFYAWGEWRTGDCTAWANHVGIVVETFGPVIKVIEGNKDDAVAYRYIFLNDIEIRGYGLPDYRKFVAATGYKPGSE